MRADKLTVRGQRDVHQALLLKQRVHHVDDGALVVVPLQAVLLGGGGRDRAPVTAVTTAASFHGGCGKLVRSWVHDRPYGWSRTPLLYKRSVKI